MRARTVLLLALSICVLTIGVRANEKPTPEYQNIMKSNGATRRPALRSGATSGLRPSATPSKALASMLLSAPGFIPSQNGRIHVRGSHGQIQYVVDGVPMTPCEVPPARPHCDRDDARRAAHRGVDHRCGGDRRAVGPHATASVHGGRGECR